MANYKLRKEKAEWILKLATEIHSTVLKMKQESTNSPSRLNGTIKNLCPELFKASSELKQMSEWCYSE